MGDLTAATNATMPEMMGESIQCKIRAKYDAVDKMAAGAPCQRYDAAMCYPAKCTHRHQTHSQEGRELEPYQTLRE